MSATYLIIRYLPTYLEQTLSKYNARGTERRI